MINYKVCISILCVMVSLVASDKKEKPLKQPYQKTFGQFIREGGKVEIDENGRLIVKDLKKPPGWLERACYQDDTYKIIRSFYGFPFHITQLDISRTMTTILPDMSMLALVVLIISNNPGIKIPDNYLPLSLKTVIAKDCFTAASSTSGLRTTKITTLDVSNEHNKSKPHRWDTCSFMHYPPNIKVIPADVPSLGSTGILVPETLEKLIMVNTWCDRKLPEGLLTLVGLKTLDISGTVMSKIPDGSLPPHLKTLRAVNCKLQCLPRDELERVGVEELRVGDWDLEDSQVEIKPLPDCVKKLVIEQSSPHVWAKQLGFPVYKKEKDGSWVCTRE